MKRLLRKATRVAVLVGVGLGAHAQAQAPNAPLNNNNRANGPVNAPLNGAFPFTANGAMTFPMMNGGMMNGGMMNGAVPGPGTAPANAQPTPPATPSKTTKGDTSAASGPSCGPYGCGNPWVQQGFYPPQGFANPADGPLGCQPHPLGVQGIHITPGYDYTLGYCTYGAWYPHALGLINVPPNRAWVFPYAGYTLYPGEPGSCCASQSDYSHVNWLVPPPVNAQGVLAKLQMMGIPVEEPETQYLGKNPCLPGNRRLPIPNKWYKEWEKQLEEERDAREKEKEDMMKEKEDLKLKEKDKDDAKDKDEPKGKENTKGKDAGKK